MKNFKRDKKLAVIFLLNFISMLLEFYVFVAFSLKLLFNVNFCLECILLAVIFLYIIFLTIIDQRDYKIEFLKLLKGYVDDKPNFKLELEIALERNDIRKLNELLFESVKLGFYFLFFDEFLLMILLAKENGVFTNSVIMTIILMMGTWLLYKYYKNPDRD